MVFISIVDHPIQVHSRPFQFPSITSHGICIYDNFARFVIADLLDDPCFLPMQSAPPGGLLHFIDKTQPSDINLHSNTNLSMQDIAATLSILKYLPEDIDTTCMGLSVLYKFGKVGMDTINVVLDKVLEEHVCDVDNILQTYFDAERPRIDPVVITNALFLFHLAGRGQQVLRSQTFVEDLLLHKGYEGGTLYYASGEAFLFHVARLVNAFPDWFAGTGMRDLLVKRLMEHEITFEVTAQSEPSNNCLALAMYLSARLLSGLHTATTYLHQLLGFQKENGSWGFHPYYHLGVDRKIWLGNQGVTTAFVLLALTKHSVRS